MSALREGPPESEKAAHEGREREDRKALTAGWWTLLDDPRREDGASSGESQRRDRGGEGEDDAKEGGEVVGSLGNIHSINLTICK